MTNNYDCTLYSLTGVNNTFITTQHIIIIRVKMSVSTQEALSVSQ